MLYLAVRVQVYKYHPENQVQKQKFIVQNYMGKTFCLIGIYDCNEYSNCKFTKRNTSLRTVQATIKAVCTTLRLRLDFPLFICFSILLICLYSVEIRHGYFDKNFVCKQSNFNLLSVFLLNKKATNLKNNGKNKIVVINQFQFLIT